MTLAKKCSFFGTKFPKNHNFLAKKLVSRRLIIISVYIIIVTLLHIATDRWFQLISIKAQLLENAWSCLTCLYIMNIAKIYCNSYVETYVGSQHVNILKRYLLDNNIQTSGCHPIFEIDDWTNHIRDVSQVNLRFFSKNEYFNRNSRISKPIFRVKFHMKHVASKYLKFCVEFLFESKRARVHFEELKCILNGSKNIVPLMTTWWIIFICTFWDFLRFFEIFELIFDILETLFSAWVFIKIINESLEAAQTLQTTHP